MERRRKEAALRNTWRAMCSERSVLCADDGVRGHAPPSAFGRAAASPQTRQMRCWPSSERTTNPSSRRKRQDSLSLSLVLFPPKPLRWVSAGALLGAVIKTPVLYFLHFCVGGITYPPVAVAVSEQPGAGFISAEKTAFSEWVLCADGHAVPSCTQCFFGTSVWGVVSLPSACASCCRNAGRPRVTVAYLPFLCRHSTRPVWAEYPHGGYTRHPSP